MSKFDEIAKEVKDKPAKRIATTKADKEAFDEQMQSEYKKFLMSKAISDAMANVSPEINAQRPINYDDLTVKEQIEVDRKLGVFEGIQLPQAKDEPNENAPPPPDGQL